MNRLIIVALLLLSLGSTGWALYERLERQHAVDLIAEADGRTLKAENEALLQRDRAEASRQLAEKQLIMAEEARKTLEACCSKRK